MARVGRWQVIGGRHAAWLLLCAALAIAMPARAGPAGITWALVDWPPMFMFDPTHPPGRVEELGDGVADRAMAEIIVRLPGFEHRFEPVSRGRLWRALKGDSDVCYAAMLRTPEREKQYYLVPLLPLPPLSLVLRAELLTRLTAETGSDEISLAALLARGELRGGLEAQRSYGQQLDRQLAAAATPLPREGVAAPGQLTRLVALGRYDYTLEYPLTIEHMRRKGSLGQAELRMLPLSETREWPVAHVACTRSPAGREAALAIARAVSEAARERGLREAMLGWLPGPPRPSSRARLDAFFDGLARGVALIE